MNIGLLSAFALLLVLNLVLYLAHSKQPTTHIEAHNNTLINVGGDIYFEIQK